ncbi:MAG: nitroreductase family protein, partial [Muribaculaceae bacterium]|nr:nitroreductase family protein [Muribaculaceae bacterium]
MKIKNAIPDSYKTNEAYMSILSRVSVRRYTDQPVSSDQMSAILHAAMSAPSGVNKQPWEFIVVDNPISCVVGSSQTRPAGTGQRYLLAS